MTENPNTQPDPNAGQPPEPAASQSLPGQPTTPRPAPEPAGRAGESAAEPGAEPRTEAGTGPGTEPPAAQTPATGSTAESPWGGPAGEEPEFAEPAGPNPPDTGLAATFLPGIDAASVLAVLVAALAAGAYLLVNPLVQAHDAARTWSDFKNNVPRTKQDPFGVQRDWVSYQSWAHIILGLVAVLLALLVLALWTARRNKLRSRSFAQAALVLGLAVVLYGILLKTGAVGSQIPSMKEISSGLSSSQ